MPGSPLFNRTTLLPRRADSIIRILICSCVFFFCAATLSNIRHFRSRARESQNRRGHKIIVQHNVRVPQKPLRFNRKQFRIAGSGAHQINFPNR